MDSSVSYYMTTYPLDRPGVNRKSVTIGTPNSDQSQPSFWIKTLTFNNSIINPVNSGQMTVTFDKPQITDIYGLVKEGDCFQLYENFGGKLSSLDTCVFTGYFGSPKINVATGTNQGTEVTYYFYNLLGQWEKQTAITSFQGQVNQGLTNINSNQIPLGQVLATLVKGSLFDFLLQATNGIPGESAVIPTTSYNGVPLPVRLDSGSLQLTDTVWTYVATNMTKNDALAKVLYPYQEIYYQEPTGGLVLGYLNTLTANKNPGFNFHLGTAPDNSYNGSNKTVYGPSGNFTKIEIVHAAAMIPNQIITTLVNMPFFPPLEVDGKPVNYVAAMDNPFTRPADLLASGYFQVTQVDVDAINESMITDPTLLSLIRTNLPETNYKLLNVSGQPTVAATYSARRLAMENFKDTAVFVTQPRTAAGQAGATPLGMMCNFDFPTMLDRDSTQLYCHTTTTTFGSQGTVFVLEFCKPGAITAYWQGKNK